MPYEERPYAVQYTFPIRGTSLIGGRSGAGKTRLMVQMIKSMLKGEDIFGCKCLCPIRPIYFGYDRPIESFHETLNDMNVSFTEKELKIVSKFFDSKQEPPTKEELTGYNFAIIDGIDMIVPAGKIIDLSSVFNSIRGCTRVAIEAQAAFLGLMGTTKDKGDNYVFSREMLIGSGAFGRASETVIVLVGDEEDETDKLRTIYIDRRRKPKEILEYTFLDDGWLHPAGVQIEITLSPKAEVFLKFFPEEDTITTAELWRLNQSLKEPVSRKTFFRILDDLENKYKLISSPETGEYKLKNSKPN